MSHRSPQPTSNQGRQRIAPGGGWFLPGGIMGKIAPWRSMAAGLLLTGLMAGCSFTTKQSTLDPKGLIARHQLSLFMITVWVSLFIFVTVGLTMAVVVWVYRERKSDHGKPYKVYHGHGNPLVEIGLIGAAIALLVIVAIPTLKNIAEDDTMPTDQPYWQGSLLGNWWKGTTGNSQTSSVLGNWQGNAPEQYAGEPLEITVYGYQWWWAFDYKQFGVVTANEFVIPAGKVVRYNLRSNNVIHSFWLPKLGGKVDLIPGRANWMWLMADTPELTPDIYGVYYGQCAQYCGESHADMLFRARVVTDEEFVQWIADNKTFRFPPGHEPDAAGLSQPPEKVLAAAKTAWAKFQADGKADQKSLTTAEQKGAYVFMNTCVRCHTINGTLAQGLDGPNLTRIASRTAIAAGILDNLDAKALEKNPRSIQIDPKLQADNLFNWIKHSYDYKPGNLMWYPKEGLRDILAADAKKGEPVTDDDIHNIVAFLQTLK